MVEDPEGNKGIEEIEEIEDSKGRTQDRRGAGSRVLSEVRHTSPSPRTFLTLPQERQSAQSHFAAHQRGSNPSVTVQDLFPVGWSIGNCRKAGHFLVRMSPPFFYVYVNGPTGLRLVLRSTSKTTFQPSSVQCSRNYKRSIDNGSSLHIVRPTSLYPTDVCGARELIFLRQQMKNWLKVMPLHIKTYLRQPLLPCCLLYHPPLYNRA